MGDAPRTVVRAPADRRGPGEAQDRDRQLLVAAGLLRQPPGQIVAPLKAAIEAAGGALGAGTVVNY